MKKIVFTLVFSLLSAVSFGSVLSDMSDAIAKLGRYKVTFLFDIEGGYLARGGEYLVDGDKYKLSMDLVGQEILGDGDVRYTINRAQHEVVIESFESSDDSTPLIVRNPARAFTSLDQHFDSEVISDDRKTILLKLTPKDKSGLLVSSTIEIDTKKSLPRAVTYVAEGETIRVVIVDISKSSDRVDISYPIDYEVVDIR